MSLVNLPAPRLPDAPAEYSQDYVADLIRSLELFISQERSAGEQRATKMTFTDLPASDTGLEAGALYRMGNDVRISLIDMAVPDGASASGAIGTVTVSTA